MTAIADTAPDLQGETPRFHGNIYGERGKLNYLNGLVLLFRFFLARIPVSKKECVSVNIEMLPGLTNVIRFPVEQRARPSYGLLVEIEPDIREVLNVAEAFGLEGADPNLKDATDQETARYLAEQVLPVAGPDLNKVLDELLAPGCGARDRGVPRCPCVVAEDGCGAEAVA